MNLVYWNIFLSTLHLWAVLVLCDKYTKKISLENMQSQYFWRLCSHSVTSIPHWWSNPPPPPHQLPKKRNIQERTQRDLRQPCGSLLPWVAGIECPLWVESKGKKVSGSRVMIMIHRALHDTQLVHAESVSCLFKASLYSENPISSGNHLCRTHC